MKTKCSFKIKEEQRFKQPDNRMRARLKSAGLLSFMSHDEIGHAQDRFKKYKAAMAIQRVEE